MNVKKVFNPLSIYKMKNSQVMKLLKAKEKGFNKKMMENLFWHNWVAAWEAWLWEMTIENFKNAWEYTQLWLNWSIKELFKDF